MSWANVSSQNVTEFPYACYSPYSSSMCARHIVVSVFGLLTLIAAVYKVVFFHIRRHDLWYQYVLFYAASVEMIILITHWMAVQNTGMLFAALIVQEIQGATLVFFYCSMAARQVHREAVAQKILLPALVVDILYFFATMVYAWVTLQKDERECKRSPWIQFSLGSLLLSVVFIIGGAIITRTMFSIQMEKPLRRSILTNFWSLAVALLASALCSTIVDAVALSDSGASCRAIFGEEEGSEQVFRYLFMRCVHYLVPIWAMLIVFPIPKKHEEFQPLLSTQYHNFEDEPQHNNKHTATPAPTPTSTSNYRWE